MILSLLFPSAFNTVQLLGRVGAEPKVISGESSESDASREWTMVTFKIATNHPYYEEGAFVVQTDMSRHVCIAGEHILYVLNACTTQHIQLLTYVYMPTYTHTTHTVAACVLLRCNSLPETSATLVLPPPACTNMQVSSTIDQCGIQ